jgi:hypothetical protein
LAQRRGCGSLSSNFTCGNNLPGTSNQHILFRQLPTIVHVPDAGQLNQRTPRRTYQVVLDQGRRKVVFVRGNVSGLKAASFDVAQNSRPELDAIA